MVPDALLQTKQNAPRQQVLVIYAQHQCGFPYTRANRKRVADESARLHDLGRQRRQAPGQHARQQALQQRAQAPRGPEARRHLLPQHAAKPKPKPKREREVSARLHDLGRQRRQAPGQHTRQQALQQRAQAARAPEARRHLLPQHARAPDLQAHIQRHLRCGRGPRVRRLRIRRRVLRRLAACRAVGVEGIGQVSWIGLC